jgi:hypothetical protein
MVELCSTMNLVEQRFKTKYALSSPIFLLNILLLRSGVIPLSPPPDRVAGKENLPSILTPYELMARMEKNKARVMKGKSVHEFQHRAVCRFYCSRTHP